MGAHPQQQDLLIILISHASQELRPVAEKTVVEHAADRLHDRELSGL